MIQIRKSPTADSRTCDWSKVTKEQLLEASEMHIGDVALAMDLLMSMLADASADHDWTKLQGIAQFHEDLQTGFQQTIWWDDHRRVERHHLNHADGVRDDVNLIDVLEFIADGVMAGAARSGVDKIYMPEISDEVLRKAFVNTFNLLKANVEVVDGD